MLNSVRKRTLVMAVAGVGATFASMQCLAADVSFIAPNGSWHVAANWSDGNIPSNLGDFYFVQHAVTATYSTGNSSVASAIISDDSTGSLNVTGGHLTVTGGGNSFAIGRGLNIDPSLHGGGVVNLSGSAILEIGGSDPVVGARDKGVLDVGGSSQVIPTNVGGTYWRLGNYGPSFDAGLQGNGLLNVHNNGSFQANVIFIADNDATGELRVSDNGSVVLTDNLVARPNSTPSLAGSATVRMTGSHATLQAHGLEAASATGQVPTLFRFDADSGGVSKITLTDAINITHDNLQVNLNGFVLPNQGTMLLFDGDQALAGNRIFGTFDNLTVNGVLNPSNYAVVYNQALGDILLQAVPEPTSLGVLAVGAMLLTRRRRI